MLLFQTETNINFNKSIQVFQTVAKERKSEIGRIDGYSITLQRWNNKILQLFIKLDSFNK